VSAVWKTGDELMIRHGDRAVRGHVILASPNGKSLMLGFEAILAGCVGTMPVLQEDDGSYRVLIDGSEVALSAVPGP
jgi:hypothetical protein